MITIKEVIDTLISANAKHIVELHTEEEVKQWLNSILWSVAGFKQSVNEEELDKLANDIYPDFQLSYGESESCEDLRDAFKAGYHKALNSNKCVKDWKQIVIDKACDIFADIINEVLPINASDMPYIKKFRKAMENE